MERNKEDECKTIRWKCCIDNNEGNSKNTHINIITIALPSQKKIGVSHLELKKLPESQTSFAL